MDTNGTQSFPPPCAGFGPAWHTDVEDCVDAVLSRIGKDVILGLPLGLGKANSIANGIYKRAVHDPSVRLKIFTALTLSRPNGKTELEHRFLAPLFDRLAGNYPELVYVEDLRSNRLPPNIAVHEFYYPAGRWLSAPLAQQNYMSA